MTDIGKLRESFAGFTQPSGGTLQMGNDACDSRASRVTDEAIRRRFSARVTKQRPAAPQLLRRPNYIAKCSEVTGRIFLSIRTAIRRHRTWSRHQLNWPM
jgi:hypothetical protein